MGLIAGLATPFVMTTLDRIKHQTEAREINSALRFARSEAITRKTVTTFNGNIGNKRYWISNKGEKKPSNSRTLDSGFTMKFINSNQETIKDGKFAIKFYPRGNSSGGSILVENKTPKNTEPPYEITIDPITGSSRIEQETE